MGAVPVTMRIAGRELSVFRTCGWIGFAAGCTVAVGVGARLALSPATEALLIAVAVATFLALAMVTKILAGREVLVYYHHEIAVLTAVGLAAWAAGAPVLAHLDAMALAVGSFLTFGRIGCLLAGCCHGRRARHGIVYDERHMRAGLPEFLVGVRLLPLQAIEAAFAAALVVAGVAVLDGAPGSAFGLYVSGYAIARFGLEELRGDLVRRYRHGLSEAQWTSLAVASGAAVAALAGVLPHPREHVVVAVALLLVAPLAARRRRTDLLAPAHLREIVRELPAPRPGRPRLVETSQGLLLSSGFAGDTEHYTLSHRPGSLGASDAERLAAVIMWLRPAAGAARVVGGAAGAYHVILDSSQRPRLDPEGQLLEAPPRRASRQ